jgi:hypothetical protein
MRGGYFKDRLTAKMMTARKNKPTLNVITVMMNGAESHSWNGNIINDVTTMNNPAANPARPVCGFIVRRFLTVPSRPLASVRDQYRT